MAFFEMGPEEKAFIKRRFAGHRLTFVKDPLSEKTLSSAAQADILGVFIYSKVGKKELAKLPKLKMIATFSTGYDHIDAGACRKRRITVCNVPSYGSHTVAEHAIALMLTLAKKIVQSVERTRQGNFSLEGLRTFDLRQKKLGLIGFGKIGSHVAKTAKALGMNVTVFDPYADTNLMELLGCQRGSLEDVLKTADIISLHALLTPETKHIINANAIARMKKGVLIINTARGGLIDTRALVHAIISGHVGGAGLDVLEEERTIQEEIQLVSPEFSGSFDPKTVLANQVLYHLPNVLITPHNAFNSQEALHRILETGMENIEGFLSKTIVNEIRPSPGSKRP